MSKCQLQNEKLGEIISYINHSIISHLKYSHLLLKSEIFKSKFRNHLWKVQIIVKEKQIKRSRPVAPG